MEKGIGLALGAGGARGLAHIHVLAALDDLGLRPQLIAGSSIGAVIGAAYASGMTASEIAKYVSQLFSNRQQILGKVWGMRPASFKEFFGTNRQTLFPLQIDNLLDAFLPEDFPRSFSDLQIQTLVTATDFYGNRLKVLKSGRLLPALAASTAIPVIFNPIIIDQRVLIDGGINNPVPFDLISGKGLVTIAVDVLGLPRGTDGELPGRFDAAFGASQLMMHSIIHHKLREHPPSVYLEPRAPNIRVLDFLKVDEIMEATSSIREEAKRKIHLSLDALDNSRR